MDNPSLPEIDALHQLLNYDPETGVLTWRARPPYMFSWSRQKTSADVWNKRYAGTPTAVNKRSGYVSFVIHGRRVMGHIVAWAMHYGQWPTLQVDHINGNRSDNRIENLRCVTPVQNQWNSKKKCMQSGYSSRRGAHWHKVHNRWSASIRVHLGYFDSEGEASAAYEEAARRIQGRYYIPNGVRPGD